jgi:cytochrome c oxidase subunit II
MRAPLPGNSCSLLVLGLVSGIFLAACEGAPSAIDPRGPNAEAIDELWWLLAAMGLAVYFGVMGLLGYSLVRRPSRRTGPRSYDDAALKLIVIGGIIVPSVVLLATWALTLRSMVAFSAPPREPALTIEITGFQFWWEIRYSDADVVTANEIHIPVGEPVEFRVTSADVIHSFWVPQLGGKIDLIPGRVNTIWLEAGEPGVFRGLCAEYCGVQHTHMHLLVIAQPPEEYAAWVEGQRRPAVEPATEEERRGQEIFLNQACAACHAIRGTPADGRAGPDLTHLASRRTIGAAILDNHRENLARWVRDPQADKPGNYMPAINLEAPDFDALIAYLESLE